MTQEERWLLKYNEVLAFMERERRNPSKHRIEEHDMLNWMKANCSPNAYINSFVIVLY